MKTRERLARIKKSKSWTERLALAKDRLPGTRFDIELPFLIGALQAHRNYSPAKRDLVKLPDGLPGLGALALITLSDFGVELATAVADGNSELFREWADAIDTWKSHKPFEDKLRAAIIRFCVPPQGVFSVRSIENHLVKVRLAAPALRYDEHDDLRRTIRKICAEANIRTDHKAGRPIKADAKAKKKAR